jgi:hypothetical protein
VPPPLVLADGARVARIAAELIANRLRARPALRLLLSGERSPTGLYGALRAHARFGELPSEAATVLQLDEYVGLAPDDPRSRSAALVHELRGIELRALHRLDGAASDLVAECARHEGLLNEAPLDLAWREELTRRVQHERVAGVDLRDGEEDRPVLTVGHAVADRELLELGDDAIGAAGTDVAGI